jgi:hypothetical protein
MRSRLTSTARPPAASLGALRPDGLKVRSRSERQRKTTHQRRGTAVKAASQAPRTLGSEWVWALARDSLYWSSTTAGMRPLAGTSMPCSVAQERVALGGSNAGRGPRERRPNACRAPLRARSSCASTDRALAIPAKTDGLDRVRSIEIIDEHFYGCFRHCLPSGGTSGQQDTLATDATHPGLPLAQRDDALEAPNARTEPTASRPRSARPNGRYGAAAQSPSDESRITTRGRMVVSLIHGINVNAGAQVIVFGVAVPDHVRVHRVTRTKTKSPRTSAP